MSAGAKAQTASGSGGGGTPSGPAGGDLSGTYPNPSVAAFQGKAISSTAPTSGQLLLWNGSAWTPTSLSGGVTVTSTGVATATDTTKLPLAGGTMSGAIAMGSNRITGLSSSQTPSDASTQQQVQTAQIATLNGFLGQTLDPFFTTPGAPTIGTIYYFAVYLFAGQTISNMSVYTTTSGTGTGNLLLGLYNSTSQVAAATALNGSSTGFLTAALTSSYTPTTSEVYWAALLVASGTTTAPTMSRNSVVPGAGPANANLSSVSGQLTYRAGTNGTGASSLPSTISGTSTAVATLWMIGLT